MTKKVKMDLAALRVDSFVTSTDESRDLKGGTATTATVTGTTTVTTTITITTDPTNQDKFTTGCTI